jgi:Flp pilus assembly protein TadG
MMIYYHSKKGHRNKGQALVELALTLPIFLVLVFGIFEVARLVFMYSAVLNASRDAARYAAAADAVQAQDTSYTEPYLDCNGIRSRAQKVSSIVDLSATDAITINYDSGPNTEIIAISCEALNTNGPQLILGDRVNVTVTATYNPVVSILNIGEIPISSTTTRSIITGVNIWEP